MIDTTHMLSVSASGIHTQPCRTLKVPLAYPLAPCTIAHEDDRALPRPLLLHVQALDNIQLLPKQCQTRDWTAHPWK